MYSFLCAHVHIKSQAKDYQGKYMPVKSPTPAISPLTGATFLAPAGGQEYYPDELTVGVHPSGGYLSRPTKLSRASKYWGWSGRGL